MKNDLKISTFIHVLDDNNLWNALKKEKIECDGYVSRYIIDNKDKIGLDNIPLTIKYNSDIITTRSEEEKLIRLLANKTTDKQFQGLYLITTTNCNLNCDYCFYRSDILCDIIEKLDVDDFGVNILITNSYSIDKSYPLKLAREMIKAYKRIGKKVFDYSFVELYEGILGISKDITKNSCGSGRKITVFPNGKVFSCQALEKHPKNYMGNLTDDFINSENWNYWRKRNKFLNENCLNCEVIGSCGGGCAMGSYNKNKTIYDVDYNQCEYAKVLFKELHNIKY